MPLLKRKPFDLLPPPDIDRKNKASKNCPVWYQPLTQEIFLDYSDYLERTSLYKRPLWECESTGRSNLTYAEALQSEQGGGKPKVPKNNLPEALQKAVLERAQFQKARLNAVVDNLYNFFVNRYMSDENVECLWDDGILYTAKILEAPPLDDQTSDEVEYKVQLLDENYEGLEEYIKNMPRKDIKRGRLAFSKSMLKRFLRDVTIKETYMGAPWIVNDEFAKRFSIDTTLPKDLEAAKALAYSKSRKLRSLTSAPSPVPTAQSRMEEARKLESLMKYPMEDLDLPAYRRNISSTASDSPPVSLFLDMAPGSGNELETVPNPTGDFPTRPSASHESVASDCFGTFLMVWSFLSVFSRPLRLTPFNLNDFESALRHTSKCEMDYEAVVALLNCIIRHRLKPGYQPPSVSSTPSITIMSTSAPRLLASSHGTKKQASAVDSPNASGDDESDNAIPEKSIQQQQQQQQNGYKIDTNGIQQKDHRVRLDSGCASDEVISIGKNWDTRPIPPGNNRHGWEDVLIGCINDLAIESNENIAVYDEILCTLVPRLHSTLEQREQAYLKLGLKEKLTILQLLVHAANETSDIKDYMEECQEQLTELRKQKIEINRERRRVQADRNELEKQFEDEVAPEVNNSGNDSDIDSSNGDNIDQVRKEVSQVSKHESRQEMMKRRQMEREEMEAKRKKLHQQKRQQARDKKNKAMARNKLEKEEHQIQKKYDQVNRDMRKYSTLRFKPLGRDKFYNRYYYLDNIGSGCSHGSGKLFVQSPSVDDLCMFLTDNDDTKTTPAATPITTTTTATKVTPASSPTTAQATPATLPNETAEPEEKSTKPDDNNSITSKCGHGGGMSFMCQLMEHQGLSDKAFFLKDDIHRMVNSEHLEWWESFDDSEALDGLLAWLNPKGVREYCLKKELQKHLPELLAGMKKHTSDRSAPMAQVTRRSTRTTKHSPTSFEPWLSYTNKLAK